MNTTIQTFADGFSSYDVMITPKVSVTVTRFNRDGAMMKQPRTFRVGDTAEYDSYNLSYTGEIVAITEKTITIKPKYDSRTRRLKLREFAWRNYDFDAVETARKNAETSMYI